MTWRHSLILLLAIVPAVTAAASQSQPVRSDQDILIQIERDWDAAVFRKDLAFIDNVLADEFVATYVDGSRGDKAKELQLVRDFNQQIYSSTVDEFAVKVYRDAAVVLFTKRMVGAKDGRQIEVAYRYMDVFVMRDGRWQCVATQSTRLTAA